MHLPEFVLLLIATIAAIAAGLAMVASNYRVARVLFWIAALSFGSLGIVWSVQSHGYSLATQMSVAAVCAAIAAAGLVWGFDEIRGRASAGEMTDKPSSPPPAPMQPSAPFDNRGGIVIQGPNSGSPTINNYYGPSPRQIPASEVHRISTALAASGVKGSVLVETDLDNCPDCDRLAGQIEAVIRSAQGWTVSSIRNGMTIRGFKGMAIGVKNKNSMPESAKVIQSAFGRGLTAIDYEIPPGIDCVFIIAQPPA